MSALAVPFVFGILVFGIIAAIGGALSLVTGKGPSSLRVVYVVVMSVATLVFFEAKNFITGVGAFAVFGFFYGLAWSVGALLRVVEVGSENGFSLGRRR